MIFTIPIFDQIISAIPSVTIPQVNVTYRIDPEDSGEIYCDDIQKMNQTDTQNRFHNEDTMIYNFGAKLNCQGVGINSTFISWSGMANNTENPIIFRVLEDGILYANFKSPVNIGFLSWDSLINAFVVPLFIGLMVFLVRIIQLSIKKIRVYNYSKRIDDTLPKYEKQEEFLQRLDSVNNKIKEDLDKGKISEKDYEELKNKILENIETTKSNQKQNDMDLSDFFDNVNKLINDYRNIFPLLYIEIPRVLLKTAIKTKRNIKLKEILSHKFTYYSIKYSNFIFGIPAIPKKKVEFFSSYYLPGRGGYLAVLLFKKHVRKVLKDILSCCYFYLYYENENKDEILEIISNIKKLEEMISIRETKNKSSRLDLSLRIIPIILSFVTPTLIATYISPISDITNITTFDIIFYVIWAIELVLVIGIFTIRKYIYYPIKWYDKIIRITQLKYKELLVYDYILTLQKRFVPKAFPEIDKILDDTEKDDKT